MSLHPKNIGHVPTTLLGFFIIVFCLMGIVWNEKGEWAEVTNFISAIGTFLGGIFVFLGPKKENDAS